MHFDPAARVFVLSNWAQDITLAKILLQIGKGHVFND